METRIIDYPFPQDAAHGHAWGGKFLQLLRDGDELLLFAPKASFRYHTRLLAHYLEETGVSHRWRNERELEFAETVLQVRGGGRFWLDEEAGTLLLWDRSEAYGRFEEAGRGERLAAAGHRWSGYRLRIA